MWVCYREQALEEAVSTLQRAPVTFVLIFQDSSGRPRLTIAHQEQEEAKMNEGLRVQLYPQACLGD